MTLAKYTPEEEYGSELYLMAEVKKHLAPCEFYNDEDIRKVISKRIESLKHHRADIRAAMYVSNFGEPVKKTTWKASKEESFVLDKENEENDREATEDEEVGEDQKHQDTDDAEKKRVLQLGKQQQGPHFTDLTRVAIAAVRLS